LFGKERTKSIEKRDENNNRREKRDKRIEKSDTGEER
jgi:hypothetical protein